MCLNFVWQKVKQALHSFLLRQISFNVFASETTKKELEEQKIELLRCCATVRNCGRSSLNCFALFSQFKGEKIFIALFICCLMFSLRSTFSGFLAPLNCKKSRFPHTTCTHTCITQAHTWEVKRSKFKYPLLANHVLNRFHWVYLCKKGRKRVILKKKFYL